MEISMKNKQKSTAISFRNYILPTKENGFCSKKILKFFEKAEISQFFMFPRINLFISVKECQTIFIYVVNICTHMCRNIAYTKKRGYFIIQVSDVLKPFKVLK